MNIHDLQRVIQIALNESIQWGRDNAKSNAYRSAYFCSRVGLLLPRTPGSGLLHVGFDWSTHAKTPGEWLLDAIIAEFDGFFVKTINVAMECESSTSMSEFARDFGKLLNIKSKAKLYLHGLDHSSTAGGKYSLTAGKVDSGHDLMSKSRRYQRPDHPDQRRGCGASTGFCF